MNFFKVIGSFFKQDSVKAFLAVALKLLKMVLGGVARDLQAIALEEVTLAEESGKTGQEKYEIAYRALKKRFPEVRESALNLALEIGVSALLQAKV